MVLAAACWGLGTIATKAVLAEVPPLTLLVIQLTVSILFLWLVFFIRRRPLSLGKEMKRLSLAGLLNPGLAYTFALIGLSMTNASMSSLIWAAEPALILGLAWLMLRERPTNLTLILSFVAMMGAVLVIGVFPNQQNDGLFVGNLLIVLAVFCCAIYTVLSRKSVEKVEPLSLTAVQQSVSLGWALLILLIWQFSRGTIETLSSLEPNIWIWAVISGLIYYALAFWFYISGLRQMPATEAGLYLNLIPIFGVVGAFIFLGERLTPIQWIGAFLILVAVVGISILQKNELVLQNETSQKESLVEVKA